MKAFANRTLIFFLIIFIGIVTLYISNQITNNQINELRTIKYKETRKFLKDEVKLLLDEKATDTLMLSLGLSKSRDVLEILSGSFDDTSNLNTLSTRINEQTKYKQIWFQVINKKGDSLFRNWDEKNSNILKKRPDIRSVIKSPRVMTHIDIGRFNMVYRTLVPIYDKDENILGIFETITMLDTLINDFRKSGFDGIVLIHEDFVSKLEYPSKRKLINGSYIVNSNYDKNILSALSKEEFEQVLYDQIGRAHV